MICADCAKSAVGRCRRCAQNTPEARARNRASGVNAGRVSGITRRKHQHTEEYAKGYNAGWRAGRTALERSSGGLR